MSTRGVLGLVFLMFAGILAFIVKPWYLGIPFFFVGVAFLSQGFTENGGEK